MKKMGDVTAALIKEKAVAIPGQDTMSVDVVKDVINLVPVHLISRYLVSARTLAVIQRGCFIYEFWCVIDWDSSEDGGEPTRNVSG